MEDWRKKKGLMRQVKYTCSLNPLEREVLGDLAATVAEALMERARSAPKDELAEITGIATGHKEAPTDPALARLLPDFERDEDEEFEGDKALLRSMNETDIIKAKLQNLSVITDALGPDGSVHVALDEPEAHAWIAAVNDLRLWVASGSDRSNRDAEQLVDWLAYNLESLLQIL